MHCAALLPLFLTFSLYGQDAVKGIYLSSADYLADKITPVKKHMRVNLHHDSYKPYIEITRGDSIIKLAKDSVYGYMGADETVYRFYRKEEYPIMYSGKSELYCITPPTNKMGSLEPVWFFSRTAFSEILRLKKSNLEKEFSDNKEFLRTLDEFFETDEALSEFDHKTQTYRIAQIFERIKNNNE